MQLAANKEFVGLAILRRKFVLDYRFRRVLPLLTFLTKGKASVVAEWLFRRGGVNRGSGLTIRDLDSDGFRLNGCRAQWERDLN